MLGFWSQALAAEPWSDPAAEALARQARTESRDVLLGDGEGAPHELIERLGGADPDAELAKLLSPELARGGWRPVFGVRPSLAVAVGAAVPDNAGGETEPGALHVAARADAVLYAGPFVLDAAPEASAGFVGTDAASLRLARLWGGVDTGAVSAGFGRRDRWYGPARHSALLVSTNARPPWLGTASAEGRLPGILGRIGHLRAEAGGGWMDRPRDDVTAPGLLLMDLRWLPVPVFEIGATRLSLFGGVGRPTPDIGQLLLPTEPHVENDPDQLLPDQNELASLDLRLTAPLHRWLGVPIDYVEAWWQYGGEDVIERRIGPLPYPSLAGVGNLYGGEVKVSMVTVTVEYTRLLDDYFRWYVGHRVYHDGFTQDGRTLGSFGGPDSETWWGAAAVEHGPARGRVWADHLRRVGVVEALNDHVFTLSTEERRLRIGADAGWSYPSGLRLTMNASWERTNGAGFVPGMTADGFRAGLAVSHRFGGRTDSGPGGLDPLSSGP